MKLLFEIKHCPACGSNLIQKLVQDWTGQIAGKTYVVPALEYYLCPNCGEKIYDRQAMQKIQAYSPAFTKKFANAVKTRSLKAKTIDDQQRKSAQR